eukprot:g6780.t1
MEYNFYSALVGGDVKSAKEILTAAGTSNLPSFVTKPSSLLQWMPLTVAAQHGQIGMAAYLIEMKADPSFPDIDARCPLYHALLNGHHEMAAFLLTQMSPDALLSKDLEGQTPLQYAMAVQAPQQLLDALSSKEAEALCNARWGWWGPARWGELLKSVASDVARSAMGSAEERDVFSYAVKGKLQELKALPREELLMRGQQGVTLLHLASCGGHIPVVDFLLRANADIESTDDNGATALMSAAEAGHKHMVSFLLGEGVAFQRKCLRGLTAKDYANDNDHAHVRELLHDWEHGFQRSPSPSTSAGPELSKVTFAPVQDNGDNFHAWCSQLAHAPVASPRAKGHLCHSSVEWAGCARPARHPQPGLFAKQAVRPKKRKHVTFSAEVLRKEEGKVCAQQEVIVSLPFSTSALQYICQKQELWLDLSRLDSLKWQHVVCGPARCAGTLQKWAGALRDWWQPTRLASDTVLGGADVYVDKNSEPALVRLSNWLACVVDILQSGSERQMMISLRVEVMLAVVVVALCLNSLRHAHAFESSTDIS